jgi:hypothetical protein
MGLGSLIRDPEKTYSGSRIQGSKRHYNTIHSRQIRQGLGAEDMAEGQPEEQPGVEEQPQEQLQPPSPTSSLSIAALPRLPTPTTFPTAKTGGNQLNRFGRSSGGIIMTRSSSPAVNSRYQSNLSCRAPLKVQNRGSRKGTRGIRRMQRLLGGLRMQLQSKRTPFWEGKQLEKQRKTGKSENMTISKYWFS